MLDRSIDGEFMRASTLALSPVHHAPPAGDAVSACLESARGAIEGRFLEVGEVLSQAVEGMGALIGALDRMHASLAGDGVAAATRDLDAASTTLRGLPETLRARRAQLSDLVKVGDELTQRIEDMRQHLAYLRVFGVNIKITSGGIAAAGAEFAIFAQEICDCIELGRAQLDTFRGDLAALDGGLRTALGQEDELGRRCGDLLPAVPDALMAQAASIAAHRARIGDITRQVGELAREIRKKVGAALAALQIGDITRQRIEHVQFGLQLLETSAEARALSRDARDRLEGFMRRLLAAQLAAATDDFHRDVSRIGVNVGAIAADASEILRLRDHAQGGGAGSGGSFLRGLETSVGQAFALVDDIDAGERTAAEVGRSAARSAQDLSAQIAAIQNMRADVQMMALNTTLKCARIGESGKPLGVIAVELRQHAGHLETSAARTLAALEALAASAQATAAEGEHPQGAAAAANALRGAVGQIKQAGDEVEEDLALAARQGGEVVDTLKRAAARFDFQRHVGGFLDQAVADLTGGDDDGARLDDIASVLTTLLAQLARTYTMAQEREVHARFAGAVGEIAAPETAPEADDADVLF